MEKVMNAAVFTLVNPLSKTYVCF